LQGLVALLACAIPAGSAMAWGEEGHRMVGDIASRYLAPEAARQVAFLLRNDKLVDKEPSGRTTLGEIAYWADEIKDTPWGRRLGRWHYDDVPLCGDADYARYCPGGACASGQLARHAEMLTDRRVPVYRKNEALKWIVHLMGDIHQPLHASNHSDRGGNTLQISFFGERDNPPYGAMNLHAIWDVHMVRRLIAEKGGEDAIVSSPIGDADRAAWERGSVSDWVEESNRVALALVYRALPVAFSCSPRIQRDVLPIDQAYYSQAAPVIEVQIRKAGVRLARVLNEAFAAGSVR
jgi:hypothetical protein